MTILALDKELKAFCSARGFTVAERSNLISPFFQGEFNLSAGHQYVLPALTSMERVTPKQIVICETCLRRIDTERVAESPCHLMLFEMGVFGVFGGIANLRDELFRLVPMLVTFLEEAGFPRGKLLATVSNGANILGQEFAADLDSRDSLLHAGLPSDQILGTSGRQNFILSKGHNRPAGTSIEVFWPHSDRWIEIASVNAYRFLHDAGRLIPTANLAVGCGIGLDRLVYLQQELPSVIDAEPFKSFIKDAEKVFSSPLHISLVKERLARLFELIKAVVLVVNDGQYPDKSPHGRILQGFIAKARSEIDYLALTPRSIISLAWPLIIRHYSERVIIRSDLEEKVVGFFDAQSANL